MPVHYQEHPHPLRIARQKRGLSVDYLAAATGIGRTALYFLEEGRKCRVYVDEFVRLGEALEVPWQSLIAPDNLKPPKRPTPRRRRRRTKVV